MYVNMNKALSSEVVGVSLPEEFMKQFQDKINNKHDDINEEDR